MTIGGINVTDFGGIKITEAFDGMGLSGVVASQLEFSLPIETYGLVSPAAKAEVIFNCNSIPMDLPKYYISTRHKSGGIVKFVCLDRTATLDQEIIIKDTDFDTNDLISVSTVLGKIRGQCGFYDVNYSGCTIPSIITTMDKTNVKGKSCRDILSMLSQAACGVWRAAENSYSADTLLFEGYASARVQTGANVVVNHAALIEDFTKEAYEKVIVSDSETMYTAGKNTSDPLRILEISSSFASEDLAGNIMSRLNGHDYLPFSCAKIQVTSPIMAGALVTFLDGVERFINHVVITPTAAGIFAEVGCNSVSESEFTFEGKLTRELARCVKNDENCGGTLITRYGAYRTAVTTDADGNKVIKKYGYSTTAKGVTEYDGATVDKVIPKGVTVNADATSAGITYDGKAYNLGITWDGNGNITALTQTEVT